MNERARRVVTEEWIAFTEVLITKPSLKGLSMVVSRRSPADPIMDCVALPGGVSKNCTNTQTKPWPFLGALILRESPHFEDKLSGQ